MTQSLADMLAGRKYEEPPEIKQIKEFVETEIGIVPSVAITNEAYVIRVGSAAAAGALRAKIHLLQQQLEASKRIIIRIS